MLYSFLCKYPVVCCDWDFYFVCFIYGLGLVIFYERTYMDLKRTYMDFFWVDVCGFLLLGFLLARIAFYILFSLIIDEKRSDGFFADRIIGFAVGVGFGAGSNLFWF